MERTTSKLLDPVRDLVLEHMKQRGTLRSAAPIPPVVGAPIGLLDAVVDGHGDPVIDGYRIAGQPRRLSDLLTAGGPHPVYLADRPAAVEACRRGDDPVLYTAARHILPPRLMSTDRCIPAAGPEANLPEGPGHLLADLVVYQPGVLPGGEPHRSTGHWNLPGQLELFQTLTGRVEMLVAGHTAGGEPFIYSQVCGPGETMAVPFGIWHVTHVLDGPAVVFNVTTHLGTDEGRALAAGPSGAGVDGKYRRAEPVAITASDQDGRAVYGGSAAALREWGLPGGAPRNDWLSLLLPPGESLADLHLYGSSSRLKAVVDAARGAYQQEWPLRAGL